MAVKGAHRGLSASNACQVVKELRGVGGKLEQGDFKAVQGFLTNPWSSNTARFLRKNKVRPPRHRRPPQRHEAHAPATVPLRGHVLTCSLPGARVARHESSRGSWRGRPRLRPRVRKRGVARLDSGFARRTVRVATALTGGLGDRKGRHGKGVVRLMLAGSGEPPPWAHVA
jgi:hypothetical protein